MRVLAATLFISAVSVLSVKAQPARGSVDVPAGARVVLEAKGEGVQIYGCSESAGGFRWKLQAPDARLVDDSGRQIGVHFAGPTWRLTDGSQVVGELMASQPSPHAGSVAWLLLRAKPGTATGKLADVVYIRRTETEGGGANASTCASGRDAGKTVRLPYRATYTFYAEK